MPLSLQPGKRWLLVPLLHSYNSSQLMVWHDQTGPTLPNIPWHFTPTILYVFHFFRIILHNVTHEMTPTKHGPPLFPDL